MAQALAQIGQLRDNGVHRLLLVDVLAKLLTLGENGLEQHLEVLHLNVILNSLCRCVGNLHRDGVCFRVFVICNGALVIGQRAFEIIHVAAEIFAYDDGGVIFAAFNTLDGLIGAAGKHPVYRLVVLQAFEYALTHVLAFIALIVGSDGNAYVARVSVRIGVCVDVYPRIQCRYDHYGDHDEDCKEVPGEAFDVGKEYFECILHITTLASTFTQTKSTIK